YRFGSIGRCPPDGNRPPTEAAWAPGGGESQARAGRPGRPRRHRPDSLLGDKGYDSNPNREELRKRRIMPVISRKGAPNFKGLGKLRYVVEQTFALLHQFSASPSAGNAAPNSTTPSSPWPAP
ncbi:hypothetical protein AB0M26_30030, partial [Streptomyces sp. NPDC051776]